MILEQIFGQQKDHKYHIVAPPGSGKTIIGLELVRRFNEPAVIFAPTTTIQAQWYDKLGMFLQPAQDISQFASMEADRCAPIRIFTYQLISTPSKARERIRDAALLLWKEELIRDGQVSDLDSATERLKSLVQNNPKEYQKETLRYANRVKKKLLNEPDVDIGRFLHPNAVRLIDELIASGVSTVVLDECHHLLDYWAIVLRYLVDKIPNPRIVGLTATLPSPETDTEYENYVGLLGDVDFEIPTPAVVKEGDLAPYRDLVYVVKPMPRENAYLKQIQSEFQAAIHSLTENRRFHDWVKSLVQISSETPDVKSAWQNLWDNTPLLTLSAVRFLNDRRYPFSKDLPVPVEAFEALEMEDWINLLERYGLDVLKTSADKTDHEDLKRLRKAIQPFGLTLTERGMSQSRSPGDLVLSFSEAKDHAVAHILSEESKAMGERLRAIVVTDFERVGTGVPDLKGVLESDAGSAMRVFRHLATHPETAHLNPSLVTGKSLMLLSSSEKILLYEFQKYLKEQKLQAACAFRKTKNSAIVEVMGEGRDWSPRVYVRMMTSLFDRGVIRCMIGTRGIFGEGWDSLSLNTLIDLTSVTTSASVQQLRGRTIRLNPDWKRKLAHNWDVICVGRDFERGDVDFKRFVKRHGQYWGLIAQTSAASDFESLLEPPPSLDKSVSGMQSTLHMVKQGKIAKGIMHVSPLLAHDWMTNDGNIKNISFGKHNRAMIQQVWNREMEYDLWGVGEDYQNFSYHTTSLNARDLKIRTAFTLQNTLKRLTANVLSAFLQTALLVVIFSARPILSLLLSGSLSAALCGTLLALVLAGGILVWNIRQIYKLLMAVLAEQVPDAILLDIARSLVETLRSNGLISRNLSPDFVRVIETEQKTYNVMLDYASPEDASVFVCSYEEIFAPVVDQRYLIKRTEDRVPSLPLRILWLPMRLWIRETGKYPSAYHPVPKILASRKERVESFAYYWSKYVGGGEIIFTRSQAGRAVLLSARAQRRPKVTQMAFEIWR
jgi:superfamily II DNA or RNA helicase